MAAVWQHPAQVWNRARQWRGLQAWQRFWTRRGVWWARLVLVSAAALTVVAAHLYLANEAVVLWEDIRTMQYESWQLWWEITTWQTELARQRNAQAMRQALAEQDLRWPAPDRVLYVPVALPARGVASGVRIPGVWAPPPKPEAWLPAEYTRTLSQWLAQGGWQQVQDWLGLPDPDAYTDAGAAGGRAGP